MAWGQAGIQLSHVPNPFSAHVSSSHEYAAVPTWPGVSSVLRLFQERPKMSTTRA